MKLEEVPAPILSALAPEKTPAGKQLSFLLGADWVPSDLSRVELATEGEFVGHPGELLEADNSFVALLERAEGVAEVIQQGFAYAWQIADIPGRQGSFLAHATRRKGECAEVVAGVDGALAGPFAWDVATALTLVTAYEKKDRSALESIAGRFDANLEPVTAMADELVDRGVLDSVPARSLDTQASEFGALYSRSLWVAELLAGIEVVGDMRSEVSVDLEALAAQASRDLYPPDLLFGVWAAWFLGDEEALETFVGISGRSDSKLVLDAVRLVQELQANTETRTSVAGADLRAARVAVGVLRGTAEHGTAATGGAPASFDLGPLKFVRDDSRSSESTAQPAPLETVVAAEGQAIEPSWPDGQRPLATSPEGRRLMPGSVKGQDNSVFMEVDNDGVVHRVYVPAHNRIRASDALTAHFVGDDRILISELRVVRVYNRTDPGTRADLASGIPVGWVSSNHTQTLFSADGRQVLRFGGASDYDYDAGGWKSGPPETLELLTLEDRKLVQVGEASIPIDSASVVGNEFVVSSSTLGATWVAAL